VRDEIEKVLSLAGKYSAGAKERKNDKITEI